MVMKKEAKRVNADDQWVKSLHTSDKEGLESSQSLKWHVCVSCEAKQTGKTRDQVMDSDFKKQTEHKLNRVARYKEHLLKRQKRILILSDLVAKGKAPAVARNDVEDDNSRFLRAAVRRHRLLRSTIILAEILTCQLLMRATGKS